MCPCFVMVTWNKSSRNLGLTLRLSKLAHEVAYDAWWWCLKDKPVFNCSTIYSLETLSFSQEVKRRDFIFQSNWTSHCFTDIIQPHSLTTSLFFFEFLLDFVAVCLCLQRSVETYWVGLLNTVLRTWVHAGFCTNSWLLQVTSSPDHFSLEQKPACSHLFGTWLNTPDLWHLSESSCFCRIISP